MLVLFWVWLCLVLLFGSGLVIVSGRVARVAHGVTFGVGGCVVCVASCIVFCLGCCHSAFGLCFGLRVGCVWVWWLLFLVSFVLRLVVAWFALWFACCVCVYARRAFVLLSVSPLYLGCL